VRVRGGGAALGGGDGPVCTEQRRLTPHLLRARADRSNVGTRG
jgi:hypothetical protein